MSQPDDDKTRIHLALAGGTTVSHYQIIEKIGAGGMGEVYLAEDTELNRKVALKFLPAHLCQDADYRVRFKREAQAAAKLSHPNIITIHEVSEFDGRPYFAMEHVEGKTLGEALKEKDLPLERIYDLFGQICDGLNKAHGEGITHRDMKPANILIDKDGRARILDFGLAAVSGDLKLTRAGSTLGTIGYMSPEQVRGEEADNRSDIFSMGVIFYEMITGKAPFGGDTEAAVLNAVLNKSPEPLALYRTGIPDELQRIVNKLLAKDRNARYQHLDDLIADLKGETRHFESKAPIGAIKKGGKFRAVLPVSVIIVIAVLILVLKPWKFEVNPTQEAVASPNRLAVIYFDNLANPADTARMGEIATNLIITGLSESRYLQVVSSQRLFDILKLLGKEGIKRVAPDVATRVAEKAEAKWMLLGSVLQVEPEIVLTSQLVDVATGDAVASQRVAGAVGEKIFSVVDRLTAEVKSDLPLPVAAEREPDRPVADVTTHSPEAYRYFLEGMDDAAKLFNSEAIAHYRKALQIDSSFAMAYFMLAVSVSANTGEKKELIEKAVQYADNVTRLERYYIDAEAADIKGNYSEEARLLKELITQYPQEKFAYDRLGELYGSKLKQYGEAIIYYRKTIEIDPLYKMGYNALAYLYDKGGDFENSIWAIDQYIRVAPDEPNPYDTRGDLYAWNGKIDQAIESFREALKKKPDFYSSLHKLGNMYLFKGNYQVAESCYNELASCPNKATRSAGRLYLAYIPTYQGRFEEALKTLDDGIAADRMEQMEEQGCTLKHVLKAVILDMKGDPAGAIAEAETAVGLWLARYPNEPIGFRDGYVYLLAKGGEIARAEKVAADLKRNIQRIDSSRMWVYRVAEGAIETARGQKDSAIELLRRADTESPFPQIQVVYVLSQLYIETGRLAEAVDKLEKNIVRYDEGRALLSLWAVREYYLLGTAYEKSGWAGKAIEQYKAFLNILKNADPGNAEIDDARARLARLGGNL